MTRMQQVHVLEHRLSPYKLGSESNVFHHPLLNSSTSNFYYLPSLIQWLQAPQTNNMRTILLYLRSQVSFVFKVSLSLSLYLSIANLRTLDIRIGCSTPVSESAFGAVEMVIFTLKVQGKTSAMKFKRVSSIMWRSSRAIRL